MTVKLLIACGSGIVTSTILEQRLIEIADDENLDISIRKIGMTALDNWINEVDLVVTTSRYNGDHTNVKIMSGTSVITGIGEEKFVQEFIQTVKELQG
ncbi:MAG: hypothetical protein ACOWWH_01120 [Eubacteriaceae bacterium]